MKKIEDYLHLYLGCQIVYNDKTTFFLDTERLFKIHAAQNYDRWKPILYPLSDRTEEERAEAKRIYKEASYIDGVVADSLIMGHAARTMYLLSKHFDLFGLIEAGLAIDKTTLNNS